MTEKVIYPFKIPIDIQDLFFQGLLEVSKDRYSFFCHFKNAFERLEPENV